MNLNADTIAAIASPPGIGGVGIIRVSGKQAYKIAKRITKKKLRPRMASLAYFYNDCRQVIDQGIVLYFPAPNSFTGEEVIEFQGHGGPIILDLLLEEILKQGARMARPGEFSERAFLNDKLDLIQAEAIADLIEAQTKQSAVAAINSLQGRFSNLINELIDKLINLRMYVEAAIDFPEEEVDFLSDEIIKLKLQQIKSSFAKLFESAEQGRILKEGLSIVIIGKPNVGKSSLLNLFSGYESAIVTNTAGTTRDILKEYIQIDGIPLHIIDTAGLRRSSDNVEQIGIQKALAEIKKADLVLFLMDAKDFQLDEIEQSMTKWQLDKANTLVIKNKIDLTNEPAGVTPLGNYKVLNLSAKTNLGFKELKETIKHHVGYGSFKEGCFSARQRHLDALRKAEAFVLMGEKQLKEHQAGELLAEDLRQAQQALAEITGEFTSDDLLGKIFSSFCIGK